MEDYRTCTEPNIILWILWGRKKMAPSYHGDLVRVSWERLRLELYLILLNFLLC